MTDMTFSPRQSFPDQGTRKFQRWALLLLLLVVTPSPEMKFRGPVILAFLRDAQTTEPATWFGFRAPHYSPDTYNNLRITLDRVLSLHQHAKPSNPKLLADRVVLSCSQQCFGL